MYQTKIDYLKALPQNEQYIAEGKLLEEKLYERWWMVAGEGIVFLTLLVIGVTYVRNSFAKEYQVARQQRNFMMSITHEFKSPIAAIRLSLETILKRDVEKQQQKNILSRALFETDRINILVENILMATRIEAANLDFNMVEFNLSDCISSYAWMKKDTITGNRKLEIHIEDGIYIKGDALAIGSLVMNLLENAEKYTPEKSTIKISLAEKNEQAILKVSDNGIGIADADKRKIFEKFYRVGNEETRTTKGTGLGLYISRFIALKHRAVISVKENQPKGSIFEVVFPVSKENNNV